MTIEQLLGLPTADIAAMSQADLERHLAPHFPFTRANRSASALDDLIKAPSELEAFMAARTKKKPEGPKSGMKI